MCCWPPSPRPALAVAVLGRFQRLLNVPGTELLSYGRSSRNPWGSQAGGLPRMR